MRRTKTRLPLTGALEMPGDKSISHRALLLAALARGRSRITSINAGDDVVATADALATLGVASFPDWDKAVVEVEGSGWDGVTEPSGVIDARNSGTTLRTVAGVCAAVPGLSVLTGDASLRRRPMLRVVAPLRQMGARIEGRNHGELAPLAISGGQLRGIDLELLTASAQVKTAVLLAALRAEGRTSVTEPQASRDHTERMLAASGAAVSRSGLTTTVQPGGDLDPSDRRIPGDVSSAMFFVAAAALVERSDLTIDEVGINPTRTAALDVLKAMGAGIEIETVGERGGEPVGAIHVVASDLSSTIVAGDIVPSLIDEIPILAVVATQAHGSTEFRDASELRVKESDRIATTVEAIRAIGGDAEEAPDGLVVHGPTPLDGGRVRSHGDHRVAMAFAIAGLISTANVTVEGWSCVETSFPGFLDVLGRAQGRLR